MSMTMRSLTPFLFLLAPILATLNVADEASPANPAVGTSPWGPNDELGVSLVVLPTNQNISIILIIQWGYFKFLSICVRTTM